jgi:choline dehydrogenase-like flavoprotein
MPGDSTHLNIKATARNTYDAIIVGSGISGGWAAKELCEKGLKVLLLERGRPLQHPDYPTATMNPWDFKHGLSLTREEILSHPVQSRHYSYKEDNKHFYISDQENPYQETKRFDWIRGDIVGGRSMLWARACYRWSDLDFEANLRDGHGVDWPIRYKDLAPWYDHVERFIGVSGNRDGVPHLPDGAFMPPFEMNCAEKDFSQKIENHFPGRRVIIGRTANLTRPVKGRGQCQARNLCHRGCPYGAYFSTNASTLPAAHATGNLTLRPHSLVNRVIYDEQRQRATGVEIVDTETKQTQEFYARIIFLNAATMATAFILLNSTSRRFPNGLGNGSDQVGRNLMDHHKGLDFSAEVPGFEHSYYYGRRPAPIYIPRYQNLAHQGQGFLRGYHFAGEAYRGQAENNLNIGAGFKEALTEPGAWRMSLYAYGECLPYKDNRVTLHGTEKDAFGRPQLLVDCSFRDNEKAMHAEMRDSGREMLAAAGYSNIQVNGSISSPGNANHEMGIACMGRDARTSVLNAHNQMHEVPNVFITDGSCMSSGACLNPSLTFMALTARACDHAVAQLKRGDI